MSPTLLLLLGFNNFIILLRGVEAPSFRRNRGETRALFHIKDVEGEVEVEVENHYLYLVFYSSNFKIFRNMKEVVEVTPPLKKDFIIYFFFKPLIIFLKKGVP